MKSILGSTNSTVNITDCNKATCPPTGAILTRLALSLSKLIAPGQPAATLGLFGSLETRGVNPVGFADSQNNTYGIAQAVSSFAAAAAVFTRDDAPDFGSYTTASTTSSAGAWTAVSLDLDRDYTVSGGIANSRMRPIGYILSITVPEAVGKIQVTDDSAAGTKYSSFTIPVDNCLTFVYFIPFRDTSVLYGGNAARPADATTYFYQLGAPGVGGVLAPGAGTAKVPGFRVFDFNGTQIAATVQVETWMMNYTPNTNSYVLSNGSAVPLTLPDLTIENYANVNL